MQTQSAFPFYGTPHKIRSKKIMSVVLESVHIKSAEEGWEMAREPRQIINGTLRDSVGKILFHHGSNID